MKEGPRDRRHNAKPSQLGFGTKLIGPIDVRAGTLKVSQPSQSTRASEVTVGHDEGQPEPFSFSNLAITPPQRFLVFSRERQGACACIQIRRTDERILGPRQKVSNWKKLFVTGVPSAQREMPPTSSDPEKVIGAALLEGLELVKQMTCAFILSFNEREELSPQCSTIWSFADGSVKGPLEVLRRIDRSAVKVGALASDWICSPQPEGGPFSKSLRGLKRQRLRLLIETLPQRYLSFGQNQDRRSRAEFLSKFKPPLQGDDPTIRKEIVAASFNELG
jgi:hypothetical protein